MNGHPEILRHPETRQAPTLMVLLPGAYMTPHHFVEGGFIAALEDRRTGIDLAVPAIDLATITDGSALPLIRREVIEPARAQGYRSVWLGGISLGGFLALAYAERHPGDVDGLCLLAPYPGSRITTGAIAAAGGLAAWQATASQLEDPEFRVWHRLKSWSAEMPVFCGYGSDDRFARGMDMLAATLPAGATRTVPGGHEWPAWLALWRQFLAGDWLAPEAGS